MLNHLTFPLIAIFIILILVLATAGRRDAKQKATTYEYQPTPVLTDAEAKLFKRLVLELPEYFIFPQVSMGAILKPKIKRDHPKYLSSFRAISQKRVDFMICDATLTTLCLVELDDSTHKKEQDKARDKTTASAGYKTIRLRGNPSNIDLDTVIDFCQKSPCSPRAINFKKIL